MRRAEKTQLRELDALRRAGAQAIVIEVCYPLLSPGFQDPRPLLEHYANLANEVRRRDMKLVIEHGALGPKEGIVVASRFYQRMTKQRFAEERYAELKSIAIALQPDYLDHGLRSARPERWVETERKGLEPVRRQQHRSIAA